MRKYTVILLYPDYASDSYGQDTWCGWVQADNPEGAIAQARNECNGEHMRAALKEPEDLFVIAVFDGHHNDISRWGESK